MILETERLLLRITLEDAPDIFAYCKNECNAIVK